MCALETNPLPVFSPYDLTTDDRRIVCRELTTVELAKLGWRAARALAWLERIPIIP